MMKLLLSCLAQTIALACMLVAAGCQSTRPQAPYQGKAATAKIVIVIDDVGARNTIDKLDTFLKCSEPLTFAVLPRLRSTRPSYARIIASKHECILHQPMEPRGSADPGSGAILSGMDAAKIQATLQQNLAEMPRARGMNNHMGSFITADRARMGVVLQYCKANDLFFLDSLTTRESKVKSLSVQLKMPYFARHIFLDNKKDKAAILTQFEKGLAIADRHGKVIMIGHAWSSETAKMLNTLAPQLTKEGYEFITLSTLYEDARAKRTADAQ